MRQGHGTGGEERLNSSVLFCHMHVGICNMHVETRHLFLMLEAEDRFEGSKVEGKVLSIQIESLHFYFLMPNFRPNLHLPPFPARTFHC